MPLPRRPWALAGADPQGAEPDAAPSPAQGGGSSSAPRQVPGRHAVPGCPSASGLGRARSAPGSRPPSSPRAGTGQRRTTYSVKVFFFFSILNTCSFMKTITLARSKHIQTNLLYNTRGCQRNGEKPLLIHSAVPAQPRSGERPPGALPPPELRAGLGVPGSYLQTHLGFQR